MLLSLIGLIFCRDLKPVHWSPSSQTSLAKAELEYNDNHKSIAIYAAFPILHRPDLLLKLLSSNERSLPCFVVIWTTTPWSLPGNLAVAFSPDIPYVITVSESGVFLMAESCIERLSLLTGMKLRKGPTFLGRDLYGAVYRHPIYPEKHGQFLPG